MNKYDYVFIGAGAATIYSVLYMLEQGINGSNICIIEKGKSSLDTTNTDIIHVVGGAGTYSDSKHVWSTQPDLNIIKYLGIEEVNKWYEFIQSQILKFHPKPDTISITKPTEFSKEVVHGWGSAALAQSIVWHVGSTWGVKLIQEYEKHIINSGVTLLVETEANSINPKEQYVVVNNLHINYNTLFVGTGRANSKFVNKFIKENNITMNKDYLDIGCRFEIEYTDKVKQLADIQYDFKFKDVVVTDLVEPVSCRTFCVCHYSSYVTEETKDGKFIGYNGHAYGLQAHDKANNLTNFGILINLQNIDAVKVMELVRNNKSQILGDNIQFNPSLSGDVLTTKEQLCNLPAGKEILSFVEKLKPILGFDENYKIYYPEIKEGSGKLVSKLKWRVEQFPNIFFTGDSSFSMYDGGTRGIVPAAVSGLSALDISMNKL
jgi:uncharacterized FAD-dependent dehydrogenase